MQLNYNSTLGGATVVYQCIQGFFPNDTRTGICQNNSMWFPDPADLVCVNPFSGKYTIVVHILHLHPIITD